MPPPAEPGPTPPPGAASEMPPPAEPGVTPPPSEPGMMPPPAEPGMMPPPAEPGVAPPGPETPPGAEKPSAGLSFPDTPEGRSMKNLHAIAAAMREYHEQKKTLPPAAKSNEQGQPLLSWRVLVLPYLGQEALFKEFHLNEPWDSDHNKALVARMPEVFRTPDGPAEEKTCYLVPVGMKTIFGQDEPMSLTAIRDGPKNTILAVEVDADRAVVWTQPEDLRILLADPALGLGQLRGGHFLAVMADGTPRSIDKSTESSTIRALLTATGGERTAAEAFAGKQEPGGGEPKPEVKVDLLQQARQALALKNGKLGMSYLMAAAVVNPSEEVFGQLRWSPGLKRPMLGVRWGLAIYVANKSGTQPAGDPNNPGAGGSGGGGWDTPVGKSIVELLQGRFEEGAFGDWLKKPIQAEEDLARAAQAQPNPEANPAMPGDMPPPAEGPPQPMPGMNPEMNPGMGVPGGDLASQLAGMVFLGFADPTRARQSATKEGLDVVLVGEISTKGGRGRAPTQTLFVVQLIDVVGGKDLWTSRPISDMQIQAAEQSKDRKKADPLGDWIASLTRVLEERLQLVEMPPISPEAALQRAEALTSRQHDNLLPVLMELRYYEWKKLLTAEQLVSYYGKLVGLGDGTRLVKGDEKERQMIVRRWLPKR